MKTRKALILQGFVISRGLNFTRRELLVIDYENFYGSIKW